MGIDIAGYMAEIQRLHGSGQTTEHSFRPALAALFDQITPDVTCINEPQNIVNVGRPDFVFTRKAGTGTDITVGHCEAKDIGIDITPRSMRDANKAQFDRYVKALPNLIYTNGLDFAFHRNGELVRRISIGEPIMGIQPNPGQYDALAHQLADFCAERLQTITSAETLAEMMAGKAVLIKDVLFNTLQEDKGLQSELAGQYKAFQDQLIHDLSVEEFADIYAETIAYGMFAARLHDDTREDFSREEAMRLLPKSNPFLRKLFEFVAGTSLSEPVRRTIDELAEVFQATDLQKLFENFGKFSRRNDPFIHFYETFLARYNPAKRKSRGVWYTPEPVVDFIVRAVDDVLKTEFGLPMGLADTSKISVDWDTGQKDKKGKPQTIRKDVHRVQILDPAAGTGTFLAEVIQHIAGTVQKIAPGNWSSYVEKELIPRLHGFELLMASYAMCHMKLDMMLNAMGYEPSGAPPRLGVYLTNSLEEGERVDQTLPFAQWLSNEAKEANTVKNDVPVMVVIGNPPYSGESANKGDWIMRLMEAYKKEPGGTEKLKERNPKWINDDYVKFIRFAEHMIDKNGEGVLGFITNHGYLDNPTFRGMRWHLLKTFDTIRVLDLHGNAKKKEVAPDGSPEKNVFDIQQGVAIIIAVKRRQEDGAQKELATVWHGDLWGDRKGKYEALLKGRPDALSETGLPNQAPHFPFVARDFALEARYQAGFGVNELMPVNSVGIVTARDALTIDMDKEALWKRIEDFAALDAEVLRQKYALGDDVQDWSVAQAKADVAKNLSQQRLVRITYRPFDNRWTYFTGTSRGFQCRPREEVMRHMLRDNAALIIPSQTRDEVGGFISSGIAGHKTFGAYDINSLFPLYLYPADGDLDQTVRVNMDPAIRRRIEAAAMGRDADDLPPTLAGEGLRVGAGTGATAPTGSATAAPGQSPASPINVGGTVEIEPAYDADGRPNEVAIFDYIYGVLHCPAYRETYKEFLKIDFPRIPYPPSPDLFRDVQEKGTLLRRLHLMEDEAIGDTPYPFTGTGDSVVGKLRHEGGKVFINDAQGFENVPDVAWGFFIGGYQPAQKWLKDRKGRTLSFEDIGHYQKIVRILTETDRIMKTIEMPLD
ncbi:MAG: N-6 DNA methylase [Roseitalea sp.]|nr:N-6 DNA methylase [Roseitalea sp.]MBO6952713.1 N-6 DNA methylase [Rhizobiaceae bacterium]MBO6592800.1 N-6 DNA methylase [Roseitalea sp.]MBO6600457.1 N-6 DNA methylase [Roseitalea sp.]MBO6613001.1 N-6 DNA methylase [Roseitalea sp.]